ncbi:dihydroneopterin triphosphate diphosphatase [Chitinimonas koreensis]|uniref:dihydroneopterin triphosphate diphosphatase n=1 Tax=Chitinimonas koreensis TaxID=356302 RepID=UPI0005545206|nr:dihydroneopterin triphosphate diphosphatase [Chitinimonas koreensis]
MNKPYKRPESVLVVIYTPALEALIIERADVRHAWQSVTGSLEADELPRDTALREVKEEVGLDAAPAQLQDWGIVNEWEIYEVWRHRYAPGVLRNTEHVFGLLVPARFEPVLSEREHVQYQWRDWHAAAEAVFSPSNAEALRLLPEMAEKFAIGLATQGNA